ncbi:UNVERIFIED_CONTAM: hypothetical protein FKN15_026281 [Acipenser sinensis]
MDSEAQQKRPKELVLPGSPGQRLAGMANAKHYMCGYCAAFTNIAVTFPIQKALFRQQLYGVRTRDAVRQLQRDGLRNLYRGILPPLMQKTTTLALLQNTFAPDCSCCW